MNLTNVWSPGEPNNWNSNNEDCVSLDFRSSIGKFNDIPCGMAYGFSGIPDAYICKQKPPRVFGKLLMMIFSCSDNHDGGDGDDDDDYSDDDQILIRNVD